MRERSACGLGRVGALWALAAVVALATTGCATTEFVSTWKAPDAGPVQLANKKVAAFVISPREGLRRDAEDSMARQISARGADGVAGYTLMTVDEAKDAEQAATKLAEADVDAVVTFQVVGTQEETYYDPGSAWVRPAYYGWGPYWGAGWTTVYEPGYLETDTIVSIETMIYDVPSGDLLWAGRSETVNPSKVDGLVKDLASALDKQLVASGLLR